MIHILEVRNFQPAEYQRALPSSQGQDRIKYLEEQLQAAQASRSEKARENTIHMSPYMVQAECDAAKCIVVSKAD